MYNMLKLHKEVYFGQTSIILLEKKNQNKNFLWICTITKYKVQSMSEQWAVSEELWWQTQ